MLAKLGSAIGELARLAAGLEPSFASAWFVAFVFAVALLHRAVPRGRRWVVLLAASLAFLAVAGWQALAAALAVALVSWLGARRIAALGCADRRRRRLLLLCASAALVSLLALSKLNLRREWAAWWMVLPLGISYYTFSAVSYMADVYRGRQEPERSFARYLLFVAWFPKAVQGPIERHGRLAPQLAEGRGAGYAEFCHGMQLALWGLARKMVVADRIAPITAAVLAGRADVGGCAVAVALFLSAFQLYCDFGGCMDIASGVSQMLGIRLEANFRQPFLATSAAEFWRRWHVTLGTWFKDYVYVPLTVSRPVMAAARLARAHLGRDAARRVMQVLPLAAVWLLTGLWHGTGPGYVAWGLWWGGLIVGGLVLERPLARLCALLRIDTTTTSWHGFRMARTFCLFCVGRLLTVPGDLARSWDLLARVFADARPWELLDGRLVSLGLTESNLRVLAVGLAAVVAADLAHERGVSVRERVDGWNVAFRHAAYVAAVMCVVVFGAYGAGYDASAFMYAGF